MSKFYLVQKNGVPAIWETDPEHIDGMLRRNSGYNKTEATVSGTRKGALALLRELFPGHRPVRIQAVTDGGRVENV